MTLITGTPGSGKTLYAVTRILEEAQKGRLIFSNIDGLKIDGVHPIPDDLDWRNTPDGSLVVYDEAQQHEMFKNLGKGNSKEPIVSDMEVHRHTGHDLWFITQHPRLISSHIRSLIGEHINVHRPYGAPIASAYRWGICEENPNTKTAQARSEANYKVPFKKEVFKFYKSATVHTHKFRLPPNIRNAGIFLGILVLAVFYLFNSSSMLTKSVDGIKNNGQPSVAASPVVNPLQPEVHDTLTPEQRADLNARSPVATQTVNNQVNQINYNPNQPFANQFDNAQAASNQPYLSGCMQLKNKCSCFTQQGSKLDVSIADCKKVISGDMPYNPFLTRSQSTTVQQSVSEVPNVQSDT